MQAAISALTINYELCAIKRMTISHNIYFGTGVTVPQTG